MCWNANYHTHSTFCDGKNTLKEMAQAALDAGLTVLGFSSHTAHPFASFWHMPTENYSKYFYDINVLKKEYAPKLEILAGVEAEYLPPFSYCDKKAYSEFKPDYIIGSVHYLFTENSHTMPNACFTVDGSAQEFFNGVQSCFKGDAKKAIQTYFSLQRDMMRSCDFDIVGHIDLVRKRNGELNFFNENDAWYRTELKETAKVAGKSDKIVEINTGGMTRAGLKTPYPSEDFLTLLCEQHVPVTINSDCHSITGINDCFDIVLKHAKNAGYKEIYRLSHGTWHSVVI